MRIGPAEVLDVRFRNIIRVESAISGPAMVSGLQLNRYIPDKVLLFSCPGSRCPSFLMYVGFSERYTYLP